MKYAPHKPPRDDESSRPISAGRARFAAWLLTAAAACSAITQCNLNANAQALAAIVPAAPLSAANGVTPSHAFDFTIGRLPLEDALDQYQETTGIKLFYDSQLVSGRTSPGVTGHRAADEALSAILADTNLYFVRTAHDIVTLVPMSLPPSESAAATPSAKLVLQTLHVEAPSRELYGVSHYIYGSIVEGAIRGALQQDQALRPRRYTADIFVWVSRNGSLQRFQLANTTGNLSIDRMIVHALDSVDIHQAPPSDLPQPLHVRIRANG